MQLTIQFKKEENQQATFQCIRKDGSVTTQNLDESLIGHDLMHIAVETTLGLKHSFLSLLANGMDIQDFELSEEERGTALPLEAIQTEFIVGFLQSERYNGIQFEDFNEVIAASCALKAIEAPAPISDAQLAQIKSIAQSLRKEWSNIRPGETLELSFPFILENT